MGSRSPVCKKTKRPPRKVGRMTQTEKKKRRSKKRVSAGGEKA